MTEKFMSIRIRPLNGNLQYFPEVAIETFYVRYGALPRR
jgi:hypothetical protein